MATQNLVSIKGLGCEAEKTAKARKAYRTPELLVAGRAVDLVQGPMWSAPYRDRCDAGYTNWPN